MDSSSSENRIRPRNQAASPLMFESDDDGNDEEDYNSSNKENTDESTESVVEPSKEERILKGFQTILLGIPPPPAFTVPQLDSREILKLWRDNQQYRVIFSPNKDKKQAVTQMEERAKTTEWPSVTKLVHWDVYYNHSSVSEELERMSIKYKERYVGAETASCINALYVKSPVRTASARKRMRHQAWGHSPGRRLSHLARRRKAFSSANLCSVAGNKNKDKKMIMVEIKKIGNRMNKKNSAKKTKPTPKKKIQKEGSTYKRALFQSPDLLPGAKEAQTPNTQRVHHSKRNLFSNNSSEKKVNENGKRERPITRRISPRKRVNRSLSFQEPQAACQESKVCLRTSASQLPLAPLTLTGAHKQKMLWAATNALRDEGIGMTHELFRPCMTVLFRACQKLWLTKVARHFTEGSTSENMLELTKQFSAFTLRGISADPTSENLVKVYNDIMRMAENKWNQIKEPALTCSFPEQNLQKTEVSEGSIVGNTKANNDSPNTFKEPGKNYSTELSSYLVLNRNKDNLLKSQEKINCIATPEITDNKKLIIQSPGTLSSPTQHESTVLAENSKKISSQDDSSESKSPLTCSAKFGVEVRSKFDLVYKFTDPGSNKLFPVFLNQGKSDVLDTNHQACKSKLSNSAKKLTKESDKLVHQPPETRKSNLKKPLFQKFDGPESLISSKVDNGLEKNKENVSSVKSSECDEVIVEGERSTSSHRLLSSVENTPHSQTVQSESKSRTLQLYNLSISGGEHVDTDQLHTLPSLEPPKLMVHWETEPVGAAPKMQLSPPTLIPHWKQPGSENVPLPDSIMTHWQQMSTNSVNNSDKIMIDFEDTSYEIIFPTNNEDDTRASSICAPFDFPHLVDDSKSCFSSVFVKNDSSDNSKES